MVSRKCSIYLLGAGPGGMSWTMNPSLIIIELVKRLSVSSFLEALIDVKSSCYRENALLWWKKGISTKRKVIESMVTSDLKWTRSKGTLHCRSDVQSRPHASWNIPSIAPRQWPKALQGKALNCLFYCVGKSYGEIFLDYAVIDPRWSSSRPRLYSANIKLVLGREKSFMPVNYRSGDIQIALLSNPSKSCSLVCSRWDSKQARLRAPRIRSRLITRVQQLLINRPHCGCRRRRHNEDLMNRSDRGK